MSVRRLAEVQPPSFDFTAENRVWADKQIQKYPPGRQASAIIPLLWQAQKQNGYWLPKPAIEKVAEQLGMPLIRALEIATFYTMFNLEPVGKFYIQMCGTTPCMLQGSDEIKAVLERRIGPPHRVTADGLFSWTEVECLGACCNAPMVQINDDYYEDLTPNNFEKLLDDLAAGRPVKKGSQIGRVTSEPVDGLTSLTEFWGKDGRSGPGKLPKEEGATRSRRRCRREGCHRMRSRGSMRPCTRRCRRVRNSGRASRRAPSPIPAHAPSARFQVKASAPMMRRRRARRLANIRLRISENARRQGPHLHQSLRLRRLGPQRRARTRRLGQYQGPHRQRQGLDHRRDEGLGPARARRRRFPDRPQMVVHAEDRGSGAATSILSSMPTNPSRAPARTGRSCATIRIS